MPPKKGALGPRKSYGIGEWYGSLYKELSQDERLNLVGTVGVKGRKPCRFMESVPSLAPKKGALCNKLGGVCSLRAFNPDQGGLDFGPITATCPNRFLESGTVFSEIGKTLLGTENAIIAKEIPFLIRHQAPDIPDDVLDLGDDAIVDTEDVGRIDMVMVHPDLDRLEWCAVEMQAVYFSGGAMSKDFSVIRQYRGNGVPGTGANRRPDFRSCGPKRLMPQLQIKVPTLRRWGKKMAVVVDKPFFSSLGGMDKVPHVSNSDIVWFIVRFDENPIEGTATLVVDDVRYTTLERAVEGLTAGNPTSLDNFERKLRLKIR